MKKSKAFTLIELLAVIVILGVILSISVVAVNSIKKKQQAENRRNMISNILSAARRYVADHPDINTLTACGIGDSCPTILIEIPELIENGYLEIDEDKYPELIFNVNSNGEIYDSTKEGNPKCESNIYEAGCTRHVQLNPCPGYNDKVYYQFWDMAANRKNLNYLEKKETVHYNDCGCSLQTATSTHKICIGFNGIMQGQDNDIY